MLKVIIIELIAFKFAFVLVFTYTSPWNVFKCLIVTFIYESSVLFIRVSCPQTDASILGGMIVSIGDKYVDMSTKTKIAKLTKIIKDS